MLLFLKYFFGNFLFALTTRTSIKNRLKYLLTNGSTDPNTHHLSCPPSVWDPGLETPLPSDVYLCHVTRHEAGPGHVDDPFHDGALDPMVLLCREANLGTGLLAVEFYRGSPGHL